MAGATMNLAPRIALSLVAGAVALTAIVSTEVLPDALFDSVLRTFPIAFNPATFGANSTDVDAEARRDLAVAAGVAVGTFIALGVLKR
jgi:hypothetical protein